MQEAIEARVAAEQLLRDCRKENRQLHRSLQQLQLDLDMQLKQAEQQQQHVTAASHRAAVRPKTAPSAAQQHFSNPARQQMEADGHWQHMMGQQAQQV